MQRDIPDSYQIGLIFLLKNIFTNLKFVLVLAQNCSLQNTPDVVTIYYKLNTIHQKKFLKMQKEKNTLKL